MRLKIDEACHPNLCLFVGNELEDLSFHVGCSCHLWIILDDFNGDYFLSLMIQTFEYLTKSPSSTFLQHLVPECYMISFYHFQKEMMLIMLIVIRMH